VDPKQTTFQDLDVCPQPHQPGRRLLDEKGMPEQAAAYRRAVLRVCERVANESKEGGFMGFGGAAVDVRETGVIGEISRVLGL
jgi:hypothetical protein